MGTTAEPSFIERPVQPLGVRHALLVYAAPRSLFRRVEDTGAYGWALVTLLGLVTLIGYASIQTGLIDGVVERQTDKQLAALESTQLDLVDRIALKDQMDAIRKAGVFNKMVQRLLALVWPPAYLLTSYLLIASFLYAMVALCGRKPEYHTLMSICVYSGFIELVAYAVRFAMMMHYRSLEVDTSLGILAMPGEPTLLVAVDPFRIWFWVLVAMGLTVTHQLSRRMAIGSCVIMCLVAMGVRVAMQYGSVSGM